MSNGHRLGPSAVFPDVVPILVDPGSTVTLRAHSPADLPAIVEQCNDPSTMRWTTVPIPPGGYTLTNAQEYLADVVRPGWERGTVFGWAIEADIDGRRRFCGSIDLQPDGTGVAEVGFGLHPAARGRSIMTSALRLVRDHGFDVLGLQVIRWRAAVGNWASRRVAAAAGFRFDGTVRRLLVHRGDLLDGWLATITADDPRTDLSWTDPPRLTTQRLLLRPFADRDDLRVAQACGDPITQHWLVSLPTPYELQHAQRYIETAREDAARGVSLVWCVADREDDRCLAAISLDGFGEYHRRAEIGYWTHPDSRGRGVITEATRLVTGYAEENDLVDAISIRCATGNLASRRVAEAAEYRLMGVLRAAEPLGDGSLADLVTYARP